MKMLIDIDVPELSQAIAFYTSAFDLRLHRMLDEDVAELVGGSSIIYLLKKDEGSEFSHSAAGSRAYSRHWTPVHLDFVVQDIERATERAVKAGAHRENACIEWKRSKCITFSDPFGNGFCLIEFEGDTYCA